MARLQEIEQLHRLPESCSGLVERRRFMEATTVSPGGRSLCW